MNTNKSYIRIAVVGLIAISPIALITGCSNSSSGSGGSGGTAAKAAAQPPTPVDVQPVKTGTISQTISVTGSLATLYTVNLSPQTAGILTNVSVREGDTVKAGQVLAQIDQTAALSEVQQDQANVESAVAKLDQADSTYDQAKIAAKVGIGNAKLSLTAAKINLQETTVGVQPQQKAEAEDEYVQQEANYESAQAAYTREEDLYNHGAVALADLQNTETTYNTQKALLDSYKQNLNMVNAGGRPEDIATAKQTVLESQENLQNAYANNATVDVDLQAIKAAQAGVDQAKAALDSANRDLANTNLVSTINGVVSERNQDPGALAQPGTAVLQVVDLHTMYYEPTVSEDQFDQIAPGQEVVINVDAYPGKDFIGKVTGIFPAASSTNRQFSVRVSIPNEAQTLRPGMYARGSITTITHQNVVVVPIAALIPQSLGNGFQVNTTSTGIATGSAALPPQMVFTAGADNKAHAVNVGVGIVTDTEAEITSGLNVGDKLIVKGQGEVADGGPITIGAHHHKGAGGAGSGAAGAPTGGSG